MAEALGIASSIVALIEAAQAIIKYSFDFAGAPSDIRDLQVSLENLTSLLKRLHDHCKNAPSDAPWLEGLWQVKQVDKGGKVTIEFKGVLAELRQTLEKLLNKLNPSRNWKKTEAWQRSTYYFKKDFIAGIQADVTRYLGEINIVLALKNDETSSEILNFIRTNRDATDAQWTMMSDRFSTLELAQREDNERRKREQDEIERADIIAWLSPLSFLAKQEELWADCFKETGGWLLQDQRFRTWAEKGHSWYLRCVGEPMVGKTVLSSILTHHLRSKTDNPPPILSLYLDYKAGTVQTMPNLVKSLLKQILQLDELRPIPEELKKLYRKVKRLESSPTSYYDDVRNILVSELDHYDRYYIVVDGFDELQPRERITLRRELRALHLRKSGLVFMTRPVEGEVDKAGVYRCDRCSERDIKIFFRCQVCDNGNYDLCLDCRRNGLWCNDRSHELSEPYGRRQIKVKIPDQDIENYIRRDIGAEMADDSSFLVDERSAGEDRPDMTRFQHLVRRDPSLPGQIVSTVVEKAKGRFLFARLYLDLLKNAPNLRRLRKILASFPENVSDIYKESMHRIEEQVKEDRFRAFRILGLITRARRPLSLKELQHALAAMELEDVDEDLSERDVLDAVTPVNIILEITSGLVITEDNGHGKDVKLVHRSLEEFLELDESRLKWFPLADIEIARACLQYLSFVIPRESHADQYWVDKTIEYPFLSYSSQRWGDHVRDAIYIKNSDIALQKMAMQFIDDSQRMRSCMQAAWLADLGGHDTWDVRQQVDRLHVCAWYGLSFAINILEPDESTVDIMEPKYGQTPLMYACRKGHPETVRQLVKLGASLRKMSARGRTALFEAIIAQHDEVVEALTELAPPDLDINAVHPKQFNRTALMLAVMLGWLEITNTLLKYPGIKIDLQDAHGMTALYLAAKYDHWQIVVLLLEAGASVDIGDYKVGRTALRVAAERDHVEVVEDLLRHGARVDLADRSGGTPMLHAVMQGAENALRKLIEAGGNLHVVDENGQSLLHCASDKDRSRIARTLIDGGLDLNNRDQSKRTPLHLASQHGNTTTLSVLLEKNADPTLKDQYGRTPSVVAWQYGQSKIIDLLGAFEKDWLGCQPDEVPDSTQLPVWSMARRGLIDLLTEALATRQDDLTIAEPFSNNTALHCAVEAHDPDTLLLLLQTRVINIDAPNRWQRTPLHLAALLGDRNAIDLLISHDADLDPQDRWGDEPLVLAHSNWHWDVMLALVVAGANIDKGKIDVEKLFFVAVETGNVDAVQVCLNEGVDRSVQNADGLRALQIASAVGDEAEAVKQVLLRAPTLVFENVG
ncbi:MAG: hypothetical protein Q9225_002321 [Loekoesia sp. 1 TL-2023]